MKKLWPVYVLFISTVTFNIHAQSTSAIIRDESSKKPIPFATISFNQESGMISSEQGKFKFNFDEALSETDSLYIRSLGYKEKRIPLKQFKDSVIYLQPEDIILQEVVLLNTNYSAEEIMEKVLDSIQVNYESAYIRQRVFYRDSDINKLNKVAVDVKKSSIEEFNQEFANQMIEEVPKEFPYHTELLGDLYINMVHSQPEEFKLDPIKACELYDKSNEFSTEAMEEKLQAMLRKHVKRNSYFKIKSGIIGTKTEEIDSSFFSDPNDSIAEIENAMEKHKKEKEHFNNSRRASLHAFLKDNFLSADTDFDVIHEQNRYDFTLEGLSYLGDDLVYNISFEPGRGDYRGELYINTEDFAILRIDYHNIEPLKKFNLFGIKYRYNLRSGTYLYTKNDRGTYDLKFQEEHNGFVFGIDRSLKLIEKNKHVKGRRKQNQVNLGLDFEINNVQKKTLVVFETTPIFKDTFVDKDSESTVEPVYLSKYDPSFWEGYNILAPNEAITEFKSLGNQ